LSVLFDLNSVPERPCNGIQIQMHHKQPYSALPGAAAATPRFRMAEAEGTDADIIKILLIGEVLLALAL